MGGRGCAGRRGVKGGNGTTNSIINKYIFLKSEKTIWVYNNSKFIITGYYLNSFFISEFLFSYYENLGS